MIMLSKIMLSKIMPSKIMPLLGIRTTHLPPR